MSFASLLNKRRDIVTLGVQGVVRDDTGGVLLVRHGYQPGWHFPGGGLERGETAEAALARELYEEVGVEFLAPPTLWGIYSHFAKFPGDHIILFLVPRWQRSVAPDRNLEIREYRFFPLDALPKGISPGARSRLSEIEGQSERSSNW